MIDAHHIPQDYQSLLMHQEAVRMIQSNPALALKEQHLAGQKKARKNAGRCFEPGKDRKNRWIEGVGQWQRRKHRSIGARMQQERPETARQGTAAAGCRARVRDGAQSRQKPEKPMD